MTVMAYENESSIKPEDVQNEEQLCTKGLTLHVHVCAEDIVKLYSTAGIIK